MSARRIIVILVIIVVLAIVGFIAFQQLSAPEENPEESGAAAEIAPVTSASGSVTAEGQIVPLRDVNLSFQVGGIVEEILVGEGDLVEANTPLLRLEADSLEIALDQALAGLSAAEAQLEAARAQREAALAGVTTAELGILAAEAQLALVEAGPLPEEIAAAENNIAAAQAGVSQASGNQNATLEIPESRIRAAEANVAASMAEVQSLQDSYDAIIDACFELPDGKEICPLYGTTEENVRAQLEQARLRLASAQAALDALNAGATLAQRQAAAGNVTVALANQRLSEAQLELLLAGATPEQIRQAEVGVEQAEAALEQTRAAVEQSEAAVSQAEAGVVDAQASVDAAQAALDRMTLKAVFDGTVGDVDVELGELVSSGTPVVALADLSGWQVETTDLSELDVASVEIGAPVDVRLDAIPSEVLQGTVTDIARVSELTRGDVTYVVVVSLENRPDLPVRWGMTAQVEVDAD